MTKKRRKRHSPDQIVSLLKQAEGLLAQGGTVAQVVQRLGITEQSYYRWRNKYGGMERSEAARLKSLEEENRQLKRLVAEQALDLRMLKDIAEGNF